MMDFLDDEFPLGDGVVDTEAEVQCPYCGEIVVISLDPGDGSVAEYVEDCEVCCRPWQVHIEYASDGHASVQLETLDD